MQCVAPVGGEMHDPPPQHGRNCPQALTEESFGAGAGDPFLVDRQAYWSGGRCSGTSLQVMGRWVSVEKQNSCWVCRPANWLAG